MHRNSRMIRPVFFGAAAFCAVAATATFAAGRLFAAPDTTADKPKPSAAAEMRKSPTAIRPLTEDEKIVHVLNRLGFGPRPGDVQKVKAMGLQKYIDLQLNPERIPDTAVEQKLAAYPLIQLPGDRLAQMYNDLLGATQQAQMVRKRLVRTAPQTSEKTEGTAPAPADPNDPVAAEKAQKAKREALANADPEERRQAMEAQRSLRQASQPVAEAQGQLVSAKVLRAVESERQLQEVMVDFWNNHFNIDIRKQPCGVLKIVDDRDAIRPHALGKFRDLLGASAKSPAMLVYLDNFQSTTDTPPMPQRVRRRPGLGAGQAAPVLPRKKRQGGLNENYARELMELHTLGVDGGYTQNDVREVARCFTGWGLGTPEGTRVAGKGKYSPAGSYAFFPNLHDNGEKVVLGQAIPAGGNAQDGEKILDMLASHPSTMRHISTKLCERLVSDDPPASLVDKCVTTWKRTGGDIREVVRTIATSPEFYSRAAYRSKIKSPFEYAVSSVRALGGSYEPAAAGGRERYTVKPPKGGGYLNINTTTLIGQVGTMGQPLFQYQAPTGYPEDSRKWVSSGALISRLNFALALTGGNLREVNLPALNEADVKASSAGRLIDRVAGQVLYGGIAPSTRATLLKQIGTPSAPEASVPAGAKTANDMMTADKVTAERVAALLLGSPEFQRR
jgi:uncharacterized protein (DUF1800 family)